MDYCVIAFASTFAAMRGERVLSPVATVQIMPVLREIYAGCGIAIRVAPTDLSAVRVALASSNLRAEDYAFYAVIGTGSTLSVAPI